MRILRQLRVAHRWEERCAQRWDIEVVPEAAKRVRSLVAFVLPAVAVLLLFVMDSSRLWAGETLSTESTPVTNASCLGRRQMLAQLTGIMVPFDELDELLPAARKGEVGLVGILGDPGPRDRDRLRRDIGSLQASSPVPILFGSDEESRAVQRLENLIQKLPSARKFQTMQPEALQQVFYDYARQMRELGFQMAFGPVLDVGNSPAVKYRSLGGDSASVLSAADAVIAGLLKAGIFPVVKHFPGHGNTRVDSHDALPTTPPFDQMDTELNIYRSALAYWKDSIGVMVGHLNVPGLSDGKPTSLSPNAINWLLRRDMAFNGLVITDSLDMGAIKQGWSQPEAGLRAIVAGADISLVSRWSAQRKLLDKLEGALVQGTLQQDRVQRSAARVLAVKKSLFGAGVRTELCDT